MEEKVINFKPMGEYILVKAPEVSEKTKAGIYKSEAMVKEEEKKQDKFLEVIAVSDDVFTVKVGDMLLINAGSHMLLELDGIKGILVHRAMILGKKI